MDVTALSVGFGTVVTILGVIIAFLGYKLNKAKHAHELEEASNSKLKDEETRLVSIEKDVQYIRLSIDKYNERLDKHEDQINELKLALAKLKGGD